MEHPRQEKTKAPRSSIKLVRPNERISNKNNKRQTIEKTYNTTETICNFFRALMCKLKFYFEKSNLYPRVSFIRVMLLHFYAQNIL